MSQVRSFVMVMVALVTWSVAAAQPLADRVPDDVLVYVGWRGGNALGAEYDASHLKAVIDASDLTTLLNESLPPLLDRLAEEEPDAAMAFAMIRDLADTLWPHPTALYVALDMPADRQRGEPQPRIALICKAGDDVPAIREKFTQLAQMAGGGPVPANVVAAQDVVALTIGNLTDADLKLLTAPGNGSLGQSASFAASAKKVQQNPALCVFLSGAAALKIADLAAFQEGGEAEWARVKTAMGLDGFKSAMFTAGFQGKQWTTQAFIEAPGPRKGILTMLDAKALSTDALKVVPQTAAMAGAQRFDVAGLFNALRNAIAEVNPEGKAELDQAIFMASAMTGVDIQNQLLPAFGDEWVYYTDRNVGGAGMMGVVLINKPRDPAMLERSLVQLGASISDIINEEMADEQMGVHVRKQQVGDLTLYRLAVPFASPTWTIHKGHFVLGLYPQVVVSACAQMNRGGKSILDNPQFIAMRKSLGGENASAIQFADLPQTVGNGYQTLLMISQLYLGLADMAGVAMPPLIVPPLHDLAGHVEPAGSFAWSDDSGWYFRSTSPFPGAALAGTQNSVAMAQGPLLVGILLPALSAARNSARSMEAASRLRGIAMMMVTYAQGNDGRFPNNFGEMVDKHYFNIDYLISPHVTVHIPPDIHDWPAEQRAAWLDANTSYIIIAWGEKDTMDSEQIIGFLKPEHAGRSRSIAVVYGDTHVITYPLEQAVHLVDKRTGKTIGEYLTERELE